MEIFLLIITLIGIVVYQGKEICEFKCKTLDIFRIVC